jgi:hypothetical protein
MEVPYRIVIEPQECGEYVKVIDPKKILALPFSNLGQGSIPARNWVWEHSISIGAEKHWIMDDNISGFYRSFRNKRHWVSSGTPLKIMEDFTDRYKNVALSGPHYGMFVTDQDPNIPPYYLNTRVYSCILIRNDIPYRWRGMYNEDTDLSLRALKDGWCTILFNIFTAQKKATMRMKGGNTESLYKLGDGKDGRLLMAQSLQEQHPDIVKITWKWDRWQHQVDYSSFKKFNKLKRKDGIAVEKGNNEYGMRLVWPSLKRFSIGDIVVVGEPYEDEDLGTLEKNSARKVLETKIVEVPGAKIQLVMVENWDGWLDAGILNFEKELEKDGTEQGPPG